MTELLLTIQALVKLAELLHTEKREPTPEEMDLIRAAKEKANAAANAAGI